MHNFFTSTPDVTFHMMALTLLHETYDHEFFFKESDILLLLVFVFTCIYLTLKNNTGKQITGNVLVPRQKYLI